MSRHLRAKNAAGPRAGFTLIETTVAAGLLAVVVGLTAQLLVRLKTTDVLATARGDALNAVENALERVAAAAQRTGRLPQEMSKIQNLEQPAGATLQIEVGTADDRGFSAVTGEVRWVTEQGREATPIALTTWVRLKSDAAAVESQP